MIDKLIEKYIGEAGKEELDAHSEQIRRAKKTTREHIKKLRQDVKKAREEGNNNRVANLEKQIERSEDHLLSLK